VTAGKPSLDEAWAPGSPLYDHTLDFIADRLAELDGPWELAGVLWVQGETDAFFFREDYAENLQGFVSALRDDLGEPELPFVIARVRGFNTYGKLLVRDAQMAVAETDPFAVWVDTDDLVTSDNVHFDADSQLRLGKRMAGAWMESQAP